MSNAELDLAGKLASTKLYSKLSQEEIQELVDSRYGFIRKWRKGDILVKEGDSITNIDVIISGELSVERIFRDGTRSQVHHLKAGSIVGMEALGESGYRSLYYYTAVKELYMFCLPMADVQNSGRIREEIRLKIMNNVLNVLSHENNRQRQRVDILSVSSLRERILIYLYYQQKKANSNSIYLHYTRDEMASYLCVNRSALSRELSRMQKEGILSVRENHFILKQIL